MSTLPTEISPAPPRPKFELKRLSPKHKQVATLLAQGLGREAISKMVGYTPEYITMLSTQPAFLAYVEEMSKFADARLQAVYDKAVDVLATTMRDGSNMEKLRAAQQAMTAVGKAGSINVNAKVKHTHSLVGILQTIPAMGSDVPLWNNSDGRLVAGESKPLK